MLIVSRCPCYSLNVACFNFKRNRFIGYRRFTLYIFICFLFFTCFNSNIASSKLKLHCTYLLLAAIFTSTLENKINYLCYVITKVGRFIQFSVIKFAYYCVYVIKAAVAMASHQSHVNTGI